MVDTKSLYPTSILPGTMRLVVLLSGGIDSPVAAYLMAKRGASVLALHMSNTDSIDEASCAKARALVRRLSEETGTGIPLLVAPHGGTTQQLIAANCDPHLQCVLCKRMMFRIAEVVAKNEGAEALVTGDSLGQVASQTLTNIRTVESAVALPILRPLVGLDKEDIIRIAKEIGTYDISIEAGPGCVFAPKKPATAATFERVREAEAALDVDAIIKSAVEGIVRL